MKLAMHLSHMDFIILRPCSLSTHFLENLYIKWMLNFIKSFLCIYWDNRTDFIVQFVKVVYHIDLFSIYCWFHLVYFSFQLLCSSSLFGCSLYCLFVKNFQLFILCIYSFFLVLWLFLQSLSWTLYWVGCLYPLHLVLPLLFYFVPFWGTYSSDTLFFLICYIYFYLLGRLVIIPSLGEMHFLRCVLYILAAHFLLVPRAVCSTVTSIRVVWFFWLVG